MTNEEVMDVFKKKGIEVTIYETPYHTVEKVVIDTTEHDRQIIEECAITIENSKTLFENHQTECVMLTKDKCITMIRNLKGGINGR